MIFCIIKTNALPNVIFPKNSNHFLSKTCKITASYFHLTKLRNDLENFLLHHKKIIEFLHCTCHYVNYARHELIEDPKRKIMQLSFYYTSLEQNDPDNRIDITTISHDKSKFTNWSHKNLKC